MDRIYKYSRRHPVYNSAVHMLIGVGLGALLTYPIFGSHPVKWGIGLIAVGLLGHLYPLIVKNAK